MEPTHVGCYIINSRGNPFLGPVQHHDVANAHDEVAAGLFRKQRREGFLFLFELGEFDLDQFVPVQFCRKPCG